MRRMPSPTATATTAVVTGSVAWGGSSTAPPLATPSTHPALLLELPDLLEEVGDADLLGAAGVERGLDGGADVVGVDVAVPDPVAAHHDDGVADAGPHVLERRDGLVGRLEEVHDLVAQVAHAVAVPALAVGDDVADRDHRRLGHAAAVDDVEEDVEEQQEAGAPGVDDAGLGQHRQHLGRALERVGALGPGGFEHADEVGPALGRGRGRLGRLADDGEDGALDRAHHGAVGGLGRPAEGRRRRRRRRRPRARGPPR